MSGANKYKEDNEPQSRSFNVYPDQENTLESRYSRQCLSPSKKLYIFKRVTNEQSCLLEIISKFKWAIVSFTRLLKNYLKYQLPND